MPRTLKTTSRRVALHEKVWPKCGQNRVEAKAYGPDFPVFYWGVGALWLVEMGGIEPPSTAVSLRLLRVQSAEAFSSAPTIRADTLVDRPSLRKSPPSP